MSLLIDPPVIVSDFGESDRPLRTTSDHNQVSLPLSWRLTIRYIFSISFLKNCLHWIHTLTRSPRLRIPFSLQVHLYHLHRRGIFQQLRFSIANTQTINQYHFEGRVRFHQAYSDGKPPRYNYLARGYSSNLQTAAIRCVGELLERTVPLYYRQADLLVATEKDLANRGKHFAPIKEFLHYNKDQLAQKRVGQEELDGPFTWMWARELKTDTVGEHDVLIPAQTVFWNFNRQRTGEPRLSPIGAGGSGAHVSKSAAILHGLHETIERDGFFRFWFSGYESGQRLDITGCTNERLRNLLQKADDLYMRVYFYLTPSPYSSLPVVCCVITSPRQKHSYATGLGSGFNVELAALKALEEAISFQHWSYISYNQPRTGFDPQAPAGWWDDFERFAYYDRGPGKVKINQLIEQSLDTVLSRNMSGTDFSSPTEAVEHILGELYSQGCRVFLSEFHHRTVSQLGWWVTKVYVSGTIPFWNCPADAPGRLIDDLLTTQSSPGSQAPAALADYLHPLP